MTPTEPPPIPRCHACGHVEVVHHLTERKARTYCTVHTGPQGSPCPCSRYTPKEES